MKERPILFSGPMVRALLDGSKTQTRRIVKPQPWPSARSGHYGPSHPSGSGGMHPASAIFSERETFDPPWAAPKPIPCPVGDPGDRLWVRETHDVRVVGTELFHGDRCVKGIRRYAKVAYRADDGRAEVDIDEATFERLDETESKGWAPSIHMPRWASRITLEVTGVRVERLRDTSDADCIAEGIGLNPSAESVPMTTPAGETMPRAAYRALWDSLAVPGTDWAANPWVWVVEFKRVT